MGKLIVCSVCGIAFCWLLGHFLTLGGNVFSVAGVGVSGTMLAFSIGAALAFKLAKK